MAESQRVSKFVQERVEEADVTSLTILNVPTLIVIQVHVTTNTRSRVESVSYEVKWNMLQCQSEHTRLHQPTQTAARAIKVEVIAVIASGEINQNVSAV